MMKITKKMRYMTSNIFLLLSIFQLSYLQTQQHSSTSNYHVEWKEFEACPPNKTGTNEIYANLHLSQKHQKPEVVGNVTLLKDFDDTYTVNANFAVLGSNSTWIPNAYALPIPKACNSLIDLFKDGWMDYLESMNMSTKCPIPKGTYEQKGYKVENFLKSQSLPPHFIQGRFKLTMEFIDKNHTLVGCTYMVIEILPLQPKIGEIRK